MNTAIEQPIVGAIDSHEHSEQPIVGAIDSHEHSEQQYSLDLMSETQCWKVVGQKKKLWRNEKTQESDVEIQPLSNEQNLICLSFFNSDYILWVMKCDHYLSVWWAR